MSSPSPSPRRPIHGPQRSQLPPIWRKRGNRITHSQAAAIRHLTHHLSQIDHPVGFSVLEHTTDLPAQVIHYIATKRGFTVDTNSVHWIVYPPPPSRPPSRASR